MNRDPKVNDEFYVGYLPETPPGIRRRVRGAVLLLSIVVPVVAGVLVLAQRPFAAAFFEYGRPRKLSGRIVATPAPALLLAERGDATATPTPPDPLLVAPGKHGAGPLIEGLDGREVRLSGTLIHRAGDAMVEVVPGSIEQQAAAGGPPAPPAPTPQRLGRIALDGQIVDSKCYLGVMNPGEGKPHRDCAVRCIAGGIPPMLVVIDPAGATRTLLLTGRGGRPINAEVLDRVAEPVRVEGELVRYGARLVLEADPADVRRLR